MIILKRRYSTTNCCHDSVLYLFFNSIQRENFIFFGLAVQNKWYCLLCCLMVTDEMLSLFCLLCLPCSFTTWVWMLSCPPHWLDYSLSISLSFSLSLFLQENKRVSRIISLLLYVCLAVTCNCDYRFWYLRRCCIKHTITTFIYYATLFYWFFFCVCVCKWENEAFVVVVVLSPYHKLKK